MLAGDGPERASVEKLAASLGLAGHVAFLGEQLEVGRLLCQADLFLLPSEQESFGLAALEALASGVPVVATNVGGLPEVVRHAETGWLVPLHDPTALAAAVLLAFGVPFFYMALQSVAVAIILSAIIFVLAQRVLPENAFVKRLMFAGTQGADYVASEDHRSLLGARGEAVSFLRPAGVARFGELRVDVLTEGEFVPAGTPVRVTRVEGARIFVRPETAASA